MPAATSRPASARVDRSGGPPATKASSAEAPAGVSVITRPGRPPASTVPSRNRSSEGSSARPNPSGSSTVTAVSQGQSTVHREDDARDGAPAGPASQTRASATSAGERRRPTGCWSANGAVPSRS